MVAACWALAVLLPGCNKLIEVPSNAGGQIVTSQVFADSVNATAGVLGLYTSNALSAMYPDLDAGLGADELVLNSVNPVYVYFYQDSLFAGSSKLASPSQPIWGSYYGNGAVYTANAALEGLAADSLLSAGARNQLMGECRFMRAFYYFYLVNLFGDVPYIAGTSYQVNAHIPRTATATVYSQMEQDLLQAAALMQPAYPSAGRQRPNRYTADALLARLYLYRRQWAQAQAMCDSIVNSGLYSLVANLNNVFLDKSNEAIWQVGSSSPSTPRVSPGKISFMPLISGYTPSYSLSPFLFQAFDSADQRKKNWVGTSKVVIGGSTTIYTYPYKYKNNPYSGGTTTEDLMIFRLAEIYLIRAEARAQQGNLSGAMADINLIRSRAGLPGVATPASLSAAMGVILHERQVELFTEWGHRWLDLKRTDSINAVLGREKPQYWAADGHDALYPVPTTEMIANPALTQNPGY